jgi:hypothetical protein
MSSILVPKFVGNRRPTSASKHQNHSQSKEDCTLQLLFHQLRSCQSSTIPLPDLCKIESELQTYINKLKLEMDTTRKGCQSQAKAFQKTIGNLRSTLSPFEDLLSGSDHCAPLSIRGGMKCQQSGCFFRSDKVDELQRHTETGFHCRLQLQNFVVIEATTIEAVSAPKTASSGTEDCPMVVAEHTSTSVKSSAMPNDANPLDVPLQFPMTVESEKGKFSSTQTLSAYFSITILTDVDPEINPGQRQQLNQKNESSPLHCRNTNLDEKSLGSKDVARYKCHDCSKRFTRSHTLAEHSRTHKGERPFGCNLCTKRFTRMKDRNRHERLHSGEKKFICKGISGTGEQLGCHSRFAREEGLLLHLRSESSFQCLEPLLNAAAEHIFSLTNKVGGERQYCANPPNGCGGGFHSLADFKEHCDSEAGKACVRSRLIAFALPFFDHKRVDNTPRQTSTIMSPLQHEAPRPNAREVSMVLDLSSATGGISLTPARANSKASDSRTPLVNEDRTFDFVQSSFALPPEKLMEDLYSGTGINMYQQTSRTNEYGPSNEPFGHFGYVEETRDLGLRIEGYTPTRGVMGDMLQVKVASFVSLLCAVFSIQIGFFVESEPRLQNMNAILASVEEERISPTSFYRYTVSVRVPYPGNQPRMSPLPIILEINGLQRYGGKMFEFFEVGYFTYEEAHEAAEMVS